MSRRMSTISVCILTGALVLVVGLQGHVSTAEAQEDACVACHTDVTPGAVADWRLSAHAGEDVSCDTCHGDLHTTAEDTAAVELPTAEVCNECHETQYEQYASGKHALAWAAMEAMPTTHALPAELTDGYQGCGGCHSVGLRTPEDLAAQEGHGFGSNPCDSCHTRHTFSLLEAQQPQACQTCHMGFDHPQWEMYSSSKHGVRFLLRQAGVLPPETPAPTCQTCHMPDGNHEVRTAWGFLAVRLPLSEDEVWAADQVTILQALGVLDPEGNPTARLDVVRAADVARLTAEDFDRERNNMIAVCSDCHSESFAREELGATDELIRQGDHLLAEAIREIVALYEEGILEQPEGYASAFPDLLTFHDAPTVIEQTLFEMHLKHRMRLFQGSFHSNPDYAFWYGWSEMQRDLTDIREMAAALRAAHSAE